LCAASPTTGLTQSLAILKNLKMYKVSGPADLSCDTCATAIHVGADFYGNKVEQVG
jgi:hypothetical protein